MATCRDAETLDKSKKGFESLRSSAHVVFSIFQDFRVPRWSADVYTNNSSYDEHKKGNTNMDSKTMIKYETITKFEEVEAVGISKKVFDDGINGTIARKPFNGRRILTETVGFDPAAEDAKVVAEGDKTRFFQTVEKFEDMEIFIELANGFKTPGLKVAKGFKCVDTKDNPGCVIAYVKWDDDSSSTTFEKIRMFAPRACAMDANVTAFGEWKLVDKDGKRVIFYMYSDVDKNGFGVPQD